MDKRYNPDLIGMTLQQKRAHNAALYRKAKGEEFLKYQREYQQKYIRDPRKQLPKLQRREIQLQQMLDKWEQQYLNKIAPYQNKLDQVQELIKLQEELIASNQLNYKERTKSNG